MMFDYLVVNCIVHDANIRLYFYIASDIFILFDFFDRFTNFVP